jgi:hypothetical protein
MRITGENDKFYKTQPDDNPRLWINLNNQEGLQRQTLIGFASDATFQKDEKYDAPVLNANGILSIGSMLESTPMAIQAQPFLVEGDERFIPCMYSPKMVERLSCLSLEMKLWMVLRYT